MAFMFGGAASFTANLCTWEAKAANLSRRTKMFDGSNCPSINGDDWCYVCD